MDVYWEQFKTPFLCFAGFSGVGKTTLLERLTKRFTKEDIRVGYYKHDSHRFEMDKTGKDTARVREAGAGLWRSMTRPTLECWQIMISSNSRSRMH
jgi:molybdenum cofactor guanylyltransferase